MLSLLMMRNTLGGFSYNRDVHNREYLARHGTVRYWRTQVGTRAKNQFKNLASSVPVVLELAGSGVISPRSGPLVSQPRCPEGLCQRSNCSIARDRVCSGCILLR